MHLQKSDFLSNFWGAVHILKLFDGTKIEMLRNAVREFPNNYDLMKKSDVKL